MSKSVAVPMIALAALLLIATAVIAGFGWDLQLAQRFYVRGVGFPTGNLQPWRGLYLYGPWPAYAIGTAALVVFVGGFFSPTLVRHRAGALFLVLLLLVGPGLLANLGFKDHWGRPRPRQVQQFGGTMEFLQPWQPGPAPANASFPAGHPTAAFYLSAPFFVLRRKRPRQALCWLWSGIAYGIVMGAARIIQGGHFLSDVIWSAGFVYLTALVLASLLRLDTDQHERETETGNCHNPI